MKIAHLILIHENPLQIKRLIKRLAHPDADFYVHIDLKTDINPFLSLQSQNIKFIVNRVRVRWGAYSIVQATVNGLEEILRTGNIYDYINLMSGQDYPLKSTTEIHCFLENNPNKAFMDTLSIENEWKEAIHRITKYHLSEYTFFGKYTLEKWLNLLLPTDDFGLGTCCV